MKRGSLLAVMGIGILLAGCVSESPESEEKTNMTHEMEMSEEGMAPIEATDIEAVETIDADFDISTESIETDDAEIEAELSDLESLDF